LGEGVLYPVPKHQPTQLSLAGGEP
jgi:hypothetical protein